MTNLTFYFDPLCPWCWRAALWVREVQSQQPDLAVDWKFFSLAQINNMDNDKMYIPLRIAALARREGGNEATLKAYLAVGSLIHGGMVDLRTEEFPLEALRANLANAGFNSDLYDRAIQDATTKEEVISEHREGVEKYKAYGVPWLVLEGQDFGFNGPVITEVPKEQAAAEMWQHYAWFLTQPYFYEMKRNRG